MVLAFAGFDAAFAGAQQTWIVDASNGPGTNFTTISAAVTAALPLDRIFVRVGIYTENVYIDKGITMVGWNATTYPLTVPANPYAAAIQGTLVIADVPNDQTCVVSGFSVVPNGTPGYSVGLINSRGPIVLDRMVIEDGAVYILFGEDVLLQDVRVRAPVATSAPPLPGITVLNSWVQGTDLDVVGASAGVEPTAYASGSPALEIYFPSIVALARPKLVGGSGGGPWVTPSSTPSGGPAVRVHGAIVSIIDDQVSTNHLSGGDGGSRDIGSAPTIASGDGGNAVEVFGGHAVNKKPMTVNPGNPGANNAGGPLGLQGAASLTTGNGSYVSALDVPATLRLTGSTDAGGTLNLSMHSASPGLVCGLGATSDFDLAVLTATPSVQFSAGKPSAVQFFEVGMSNANSLFEILTSIPNPLGGIAGASGMVQAADVINNTAFLTNPCVVVLSY